MIKRDGVAIMNARTKNVSIARDTITIMKQRSYIATNSKQIVFMSDEMDFAIKNSILYKEVPEKEYEPIKPTIEVINETTTHAAQRLLSKDKTDIVALNFASARNVGGGFLAGAIAQEEDLCRKSGLYACTKNKPMFYNENILCDDSFYTDNMIYSPKVPFFRDENELLLDKPYLLSIISAPAPNVSSMNNIDEEKLIDLLFYRAAKILLIAVLHGHKNIILGAWGCGAFGNNSQMVATVFMEALEAIPRFEHVCFAVYDNKPDNPIYSVFKKIVEKK